jgi:predicted short-subunit dehydrogenase-like oxidoreductase (DUF2520 family)
MIQKVGIIGSGNVAWHLIKGFINAGITISWVYGRNEQALKELESDFNVAIATKIPEEKVDLTLICVNDDAIQTVLNQLPNSDSVAYTSGTVSLDKLVYSQSNCGVFYPLQTFTKGKSVSLLNVPFLIESHSDSFSAQLVELAKQLTNHVEMFNSEKRKQLHVSAVMVNNFVNHLFYLAEEHLEKNDINKRLLYPLIQETVSKAMDVGPYTAQSGPARRGDKKTILAHQEMLSGTTKELYQLLSESILNTYGHDDI